MATHSHIHLEGQRELDEILASPHLTLLHKVVAAMAFKLAEDACLKRTLKGAVHGTTFHSPSGLPTSLYSFGYDMRTVFGRRLDGVAVVGVAPAPVVSNSALHVLACDVTHNPFFHSPPHVLSRGMSRAP